MITCDWCRSELEAGKLLYEGYIDCDASPEYSSDPGSGA